MDAWNWVTEQIKEDAGYSDWMHADSLGAIADVFGRVVPIMGNCRVPLNYSLTESGVA